MVYKTLVIVNVNSRFGLLRRKLNSRVLKWLTVWCHTRVILQSVKIFRQFRLVLISTKIVINVLRTPYVSGPSFKSETGRHWKFWVNSVTKNQCLRKKNYSDIPICQRFLQDGNFQWIFRRGHFQWTFCHGHWLTRIRCCRTPSRSVSWKTKRALSESEARTGFALYWRIRM